MFTTTIPRKPLCIVTVQEKIPNLLVRRDGGQSLTEVIG
jgi:hypothetical protein